MSEQNLQAAFELLCDVRGQLRSEMNQREPKAGDNEGWAAFHRAEELYHSAGLLVRAVGVEKARCQPTQIELLAEQRGGEKDRDE